MGLVYAFKSAARNLLQVRPRIEVALFSVVFARQNKNSKESILDLNGPVVSLTTYGRRTQQVYLAIESISRGLLRPSRLILWIDEVDVLRHLPVELLRLQKRGLEIKICQNYGPHKKYYPYLLEQESFEKPLVIADDDTFYPRDWLSRLDQAYREQPRMIYCYRARRIKMDGHDMTPYTTWKMVRDTDASYLNLATGCAGVMYPAEVLEYIKKQGTAFQQCCPMGDDLWLHANSILAGFRIRQVVKKFHLLEIPGTQANALYRTNISEGNDAQIEKTYAAEALAVLLREARG